MSLFETSKETTGLDDDSVARSFAPVTSGAYDYIIDMAYLDESKNGALSVNFAFKAANGSELKNTIYITNRQKQAFYTKEGKQYDLPGFITANAICMLALGQPLSSLEPEEKSLRLYNYDERKEMPTKKRVFMDLLGKEITLGVQQIRENKSKLNTSTGKYEPTAEERLINEVDKAFRAADKLSVKEIQDGKVEPEQYAAWVKRNDGILRDKYKAIAGGTAPAATGPLFGTTAPAATPTPVGTADAPAPVANLFGQNT